MACFRPVKGYRGRRVGPSGKRPIVFNVRDGFMDLEASVPCGKCVGCRVDQAREWTVRIMHEASLHEENSFITLTYSDEHLPDYGSLRKADFKNFMKRLRWRLEPRKIRFYHCGEYGPETFRPHYHAILFGVDFHEDRVLWRETKKGPIWRSPLLERVWDLGHSEIGPVTGKSAAYVARYVVEKVDRRQNWHSVVDDATGEVIELESEYATMSRRPGIGHDWLGRYSGETYRDDSVVVDGREQRPPKYYDRKMEEIDSDLMARVRAERQRGRNVGEESPERMYVREQCTKARMALRKRSL